jgi:hypothetical protein
MQNALVINFKSPPFKGIGGRRWSKISKALIRHGVNVHLIRGNWLEGEVAKEFCNGTSVAIPIQHPYYHSKSWFKRFIDRKEYYRRRWKGDYTFFDEGAYSIAALKSEIRSILRDNDIQWVFISCPPFSWTYEATRLIKTEFPKVKIWVDLRDPWLTANNWGIPGLNQKQRALEEKRHQYVGQLADFISSPAFEILQEFKDWQQEKFIHLKHFYDADDVSNLPIAESNSRDKRSWVYAGQFYVGMEPFAQSLKDFSARFGNDEFHLFSKDLDKFQSQLNDSLNIQLVEEQGSQVFEKVKNCFGLILMLSDYNKDFFTTKFFDYLPFEKPIAYFGPDGKVSAFLKQHGTLLTDYEPFEVYSLKGFDISRDELSFRVEQILNLCQKNELPL